MTDERAWQTRVYRFRILGDFPEEAVSELRRIHELSNQLVEIEKGHAERVAEAWRQFPELVEVERSIVEATVAIEEVVAEIKRYRQKHRVRTTPRELRTRLADARQTRREAKERLRDIKAVQYPLLKPKIVKLSEQVRAEVKATYRPAIDGGLYWANYNAALDRHKAALNTIKRRRKSGQSADLRFRRWTGEGTLVVQLQRQASQPPRTPAKIAEPKSSWSNVAQLTPAFDPEEWSKLTRAEQRRIRLGKLRFRVGSGAEAGWVELPVIVHRPIPPEADICMMEITRRRLAARMLVHVSVVVRLPTAPARTEGTSVAMHVGWRALSDRSIRVGVVTGGSDLPDDLAGVVRQHGDWAEIVIPAWWRDQMDYVNSVASIRSRNFDGLRNWLLEWLENNPNHAIGGIETIDRWRSPNRFAALAMRIHDDDSIDPELRQTLHAWQVQDRHLWTLEANLRAKILARRNDAFAKVAAWALKDAALLSVDSFSLDTLMRTPDLAADDAEGHRKARANRALAAPGVLRAAMVNAAAREGVTVRPISGEIASVHAVCGSKFDMTERESSVMVWCPQCQKVVDQDVNTLELLRAPDAPVDSELQVQSTSDNAEKP